MGTPAGVIGVRASAIAAAPSATATSVRVRSSGTSSARKNAGKSASSPNLSGSPIASPSEHPEGRAPHPGRVLRDGRADQHVAVEAAVALVGERPRRVHHRLALGGAAGARAGQRGRHGDPHRQEARVQQEPGHDRRERPAAGGEHRERAELRGAREQDHRHHDRRHRPHDRAREHAERQPDQQSGHSPSGRPARTPGPSSDQSHPGRMLQGGASRPRLSRRGRRR